MSGEDRTKKIETYGYNFRCLSIWNAAEFFLRRKPGAIDVLSLQENKFFWLVLKESVFCGRCKEKNLQCRMNWYGGLRAEPPATGGKGVWGQSPQRLAIFTIFFNENNAFLGIFRLKFLLKNIFLIYSIIQNS